MSVADTKRRKREEMVREAEQYWHSVLEDTNNDPTEAHRAAMDERMAVIEEMDVEIKGISKIDDFLEMQAMPIQARLDANEPVYLQQKPEMSEDERYFRFGEFLQAAVHKGRGQATQKDMHILYPETNGRQTEADRRFLREQQSEFYAQTGASEDVPTDGGFLVGTDFSNELLKKVHTTGVLPPKCRRQTLSSNVNTFSVPGYDETSRVNGSRRGGVRGYWAGEGASLTASRPTFRRVELTLNKLTALYYATDELLEDAAMLGAEVEDAFAEEMGFKLDDAIWNGSGGGQPKGVMEADALISVTVSGTASSYDATDITGAFARAWIPSMGRGEWFTNQDVIPNLHSMVLSVGSTVVPVYQPMTQFGGDFGASPTGQRLYNRPLNFIEQAAANGVTKNLSFVDLSQYLLVDKGGLKRAMSIHVQFTTDETVFRWILRIDGQPLWHSALTPFNGSNTVSPYVTLTT